MGIQVRKRDGDRRWYSADRDLVYALPRLLRAALEVFSDYPGSARVSRERLLAASAELGRLVSDIVRLKLTKEEVVRRLRELPDACLELIGGALLRVLLGEFRVWVADARPKVSGDVELDGYDLQALAEEFARLSLTVREGADEKHHE